MIRRGLFLFYSIILLILGCSTNAHRVDFLQEQEVQLASPKIIIDSILFKKSAKIEAINIPTGSKVYYTINSREKKKYNGPFYISETGQLEVIAKTSNYQSSESISLELIKLPKKKIEASLSFSPEPSESYPGNGPSSLLDLERGTLNFKDGNAWSGFQHSAIEIDIKLERPTSLSTVFCSILQDHNSWIFQPHKIQIWSGGKEIGNTNISIPMEFKNPSMNFISINLPEGTYKDLKVKIINLKNIPAWHPGAGTPPWLFIDEIILK